MTRVVFAVFLFIRILVYGQDSMDAPVSYLVVHGTSSLHNWTLELDVQQFKLISVVFAQERLDSIAVEFPVNGLIAPKKGMYKKMKNALQSKIHPTIRVQLSDFIFKNDSLFISNALYSIAGKEKRMPFKARYVHLKKNEFVLFGKQQIKMSDFNVNPPSAMFGLMNTGNELLVEFKLHFFLENESSLKIK